MKRQAFFPFIFLFALAMPFGGAAQSFSEMDFVFYGTKEGLSDNTITGITQDATGYIWLSTNAGLNRFDGSRFVQYHSNGDSLSPAGEEMNGLAWLDQQRLAIFNVGVFIINTKTGARKNLFIPYKDKQYEYKFNMIVAARGDPAGNTFVLSRSGFYHFDKDYKLAARYDHYGDNEVATQHFVFGRELIQVDGNRLLVHSVAGFYIYDIRKKEFRKMLAGDCISLAPLLPLFNQCRVFQARTGHVFITRLNTDTVLHVDLQADKKYITKAPFLITEDIIHYRSRLFQVNDSSFYLTGHHSGFFKLVLSARNNQLLFLPQNHFAAYQCNSIFSDRDKHLWIGTPKGLFRQDDIQPYVEVVNLPENIEKKFPGITINAVTASNEKIYAGTRSRGGVLVFDKQTMTYEKQVLFDGYGPLNNANIYKITKLDAQTILTGTGGPLFRYRESTGKEAILKPKEWEAGDWTNDLFTDRKGNAWVSSRYIYKYDPVANTFFTLPLVRDIPSVPVAIAEDTSGNIWLAGHGIMRYRVTTNQFDLKLDSFPYIKMPDKQVTAMVIDADNTIWFSCFNNGLMGYNIDRKQFRHFSRSQGLPDDNISSLQIVDKKLWIACYSGMACMDLGNFRMKTFGKEEGFPGIPALRGSRFYYDSTEKTLYLGYLTAIARFKPAELLRTAIHPELFIESFSTNDGIKNFLPGNSFSTGWENNDLSIEIGSINFAGGNNQAYAYRILHANNDDPAWQQLGSQPSFRISNLASGRHRIQVKLFSLKNRWPEQVKEIVINVIPPFWKRTWFLVLAAAAGLLALYWLVGWRIRIARKKEREKTQVEKLKADDYRNKYELEQISHFFSSSLADKKTEDEVLWDVARNLIGRMDYVDCMIYLWNNDRTKMVQKAAYGQKGKPEFISSQVFDVHPGQGVVGHVIQSLQPVLIRDTREDKRYRVDEAARLSEICVPIIHNNELLGIIDSEHHELGYFTDRDIKILTTIATLIGNKLKELQSRHILEVKQQELSTINEQLAEAKLSALQAQMNPHFVFNALNSIKRMILDGDNDKASRYLSKFALMIRLTLSHSRDIFVTLRENIEYLQAYLEMEQLRFDSSFSWKMNIGENIDTEEIMIPSLMMQPLVENAIWHGLLPSPGDKRLNISFTREQNRMICCIEDNGIGILEAGRHQEQQKPGAHRSVGLDNLRNRIHILNEKYNIDCTLEIADTSDGMTHGTKAILAFNNNLN